MNIFEVKSIHVSGVVLDGDMTTLHRTLNIQVKINYPPVQNLLAVRPTAEEIAKQLGDTVTAEFAKVLVIEHRPPPRPTWRPIGPDPSGKKVKSPFSQDEAGEKEFGWWKLENTE